MIIGIGSDLVDIRRIEKALARRGTAFEERVFAPRERKKAQSRARAGSKSVAAAYAKRFAAKEAAAKALGTGMRGGIGWHDIEVSAGARNLPLITLHGVARQRLKALTPKGARASLHLTLTDEYPFAMAFVVIEAV